MAGEACSRTADCVQGLTCIEQKCTDPHAEATPGASGSPAIPAERARQCKDLVSTINEASASYQDLKADTPVELLRLADALGAAAQKIGRVELADSKLTGFRDDYRKMAQELSKAARDAGTAGGDHDKLQGALKVMESVGSRESRLLDKINRYCGAA